MRPNILFILSDQHHAKCVGHAGHPQVQTPHLDRLARESVRFTHAVTNNPICTPSRMCYLTGQYAHNHGHYGLSGQHPGVLPTWFGQFRAAGYRTAAIGKIHTPANWLEADCDLFLEAYAGLTPRHASAYDEYLKREGRLADRDDVFLQEQGPNPHGQSFDGRASRLPYEHSVEGWAVREACRFMDAAGGQPWAMQVGLPRPHQIYTPAQEFWDLYDDEDIWLPPNTDADLSEKAPHLRGDVAGQRAHPPAVFEPKTYDALRRRKQHGYLGCISHVDHAVGELLTHLDRQGLAENTIVIYTSDHGDYACEFGLLEKAPGICGDAICRIPSLWRWPGRFKAGHTSAAIVETVDIAPTLCALAGVAPMPTADGSDIAALLRGEDRPVRAFGVTEHPWSKAVLKDNWRLVHYPRGFFGEADAGFGELYNLATDPWEMKNLYFAPECREKVAELQRDLLDWTISTTRVKTVLPAVLDPGANYFQQHREADGKLSWRDVAALRSVDYR